MDAEPAHLDSTRTAIEHHMDAIPLTFKRTVDALIDALMYLLTLMVARSHFVTPVLTGCLVPFDSCPALR